MPLTKPPPPPPKPVFDEFSTPSDFNDNFKKKETTKYMNPCELEEKQSMKCLDKNNYDKSKCEFYFLQYRECKKKWRTEFENFLFISEPSVLTFASFLTLVPLVVKSYLRLMSAEYAIVYAALILQDDGIEITADKLSTLVKAAGVEVEPVWFSLYAKALAGQDLNALLLNIGSAGAAAGPAAGGAAAAAGGAADEPAAEEKEEEKEESDDDMGFGLFD
ncbi:hypothetical protein NQZ79_g3663 [Umbelopsis isabellina]|nr:hypothetical protein NQZ79_g3663 [Umbelopsis isabellina]